GEDQHEQQRDARFETAAVCEAIRSNAAERTREEREEAEAADVHARRRQRQRKVIDEVNRGEIVDRELDAEARCVRDEEHPHAIVARGRAERDRKSTRLNSSHVKISYAVFCLKKKNDSAKPIR